MGQRQFRDPISLSDVTSVFSRHFVVGFFLPPFFGLLLLWQTLSPAFPPDRLHYSDAANVAVIGGVALLVALFLSAYDETTEAFLAGEAQLLAPILRPLYTLLRWFQLRRFHKLQEELAKPVLDPLLATRAAVRLDQYFPHVAERVGPTRLANLRAATASYTFTRWGLDHVEAWPRVEALLTAEERDLLVDAKTDVAFFLNSAIVMVAVGATYFADFVKYRSHSLYNWLWVAGAIALLVTGYLLYRSAVGRAAERAARVRAGVDLHRLELYAKLGLRAPVSSSDEKAMAAAVNLLLLYRRPVPDAYLSTPHAAPDEPAAEERDLLLGLGRLRLERVRR